MSKLYHPLILAHSREPVNYGVRQESTQIVEAYNPLCGDDFKIYYKLEGQRIVSVSFDGYGCAVSKASTSMLMKRLEGKSLDEVRYLITHFLDVMHGDAMVEDEELQALAIAREYPGRIPCATLSWKAIQRDLT